jgi:hypothetical protein
MEGEAYHGVVIFLVLLLFPEPPDMDTEKKAFCGEQNHKHWGGNATLPVIFLNAPHAVMIVADVVAGPMI